MQKEEGEAILAAGTKELLTSPPRDWEGVRRANGRAASGPGRVRRAERGIGCVCHFRRLLLAILYLAWLRNVRDTYVPQSALEPWPSLSLSMLSRAGTSTLSCTISRVAWKIQKIKHGCAALSAVDGDTIWPVLCIDV
jgi:hypothetical protein